MAGSKFDTKIGPLRSILKKVDYLLLGGVIYNAYLAVKYKIDIKGIDKNDLECAKEFVELAKENPGKLLEPEFIVESDTLDGKFEDQYRVHNIKDLKPGTKLNYILDIAKESWQWNIRSIILRSETIFVNAVMGFTPHFAEGTETLYSLIDQNASAHRNSYGGGDTLQELKNLLPGMYIRCIDDPTYYFFSGGGTILLR